MKKNNCIHRCVSVVLLLVTILGCQNKLTIPFQFASGSWLSISDVKGVVAAPAGFMKWHQSYQDQGRSLLSTFKSEPLLEFNWHFSADSVMINEDLGTFEAIDQMGSWMTLSAHADQYVFAFGNAAEESRVISLVLRNQDLALRPNGEHRFTIVQGPDLSTLNLELIGDGKVDWNVQENSLKITLTAQSQWAVRCLSPNLVSKEVGSESDVSKLVTQASKQSARAWTKVMSKLEVEGTTKDHEILFRQYLYEAFQTFARKGDHYVFGESFLEDRSSLAFISLLDEPGTSQMISSYHRYLSSLPIDSLQDGAELLAIWLADAYFKEYRAYDAAGIFKWLDIHFSQTDIHPLTAWAMCSMAFVLDRDRLEFYQAKSARGAPDSFEYVTSNYAHDLRSVIASKGGAQSFIETLDQRLQDLHDRISDQDTDLALPYLFNYGGAPWKTQKYLEGPNQPINDHARDIPSPSHFFGHLFNAIGLYPVNPAEGIYVIGSPLFTKSVLHLEDGRAFTVRARFLTSDNIYIQTAMLNEQPLSRCYLRHFEIMDGGELLLEMGPNPNYLHWIDSDAMPPSASDPESDAW